MALPHLNIIFITGTDTGAGKTVLTALLLAHLRMNNVNALAIKPFCAGNRGDIRLLQGLQNRELPEEMVNPWYSPIPLAPALALGAAGKYNLPNKQAVLAHVHAVQKQCELLLVEGAGGLLSPLTENVTALDLIAALKCPVIVASRNRLGCLNHVLLTALALKKAGVKEKKVVLMGVRRPDLSARSNARYLQKKADFTEVFSLPWLGRAAASPGGLKENAEKMKKTLARCGDFGIFRALFAKRRSEAAEKKSKKL